MCIIVDIIATVTPVKLDVVIGVWHNHYGGLHVYFGGEDSTVGIVAHYEWDRLGGRMLMGTRFSVPVHQL